MAALKRGKSSGTDGIPRQLFWSSGDELLFRLFDLISAIWDTEIVLQQWRVSRFISI